MALFGKGKAEESKAKAKGEYEKACELVGDSREIWSSRIRIGLRARAHIDKSFIEGAERIAIYDEACMRAVAAGREKPKPPAVTMYQNVKTVNGPVVTYIPEEIAQEAFKIGAKYQLTEIDAKTSIDLTQALADTVSLDLRLDDPLVALQFLREEIDYFPDNQTNSKDENNNNQTQENGSEADDNE